MAQANRAEVHVPILLGLNALSVVVFYWIYWANSAVKAAKEPNDETRGLQRGVKHGLHNIIGTPLRRVRDVRLAAVMLMIQLVRTGAPLTPAQKQKIFASLDDPLRIEDRQVMFERA
jgi:hypothetical protein